MSIRFFSFLWVVYFLSALAFVVTGNFSKLALVAFGGVAFGLIFMGMMSLLPTLVAHEHETEHASHVVTESAQAEPVAELTSA